MKLQFEESLPEIWMHGTFHHIKTAWHHMVHFGDEDTVLCLLTDKLFLDDADKRTGNLTPLIYTVTLTKGLNILRTPDFLSPEPRAILTDLVKNKLIPELDWQTCIPVQKSLYQCDRAATDEQDKRQLRAKFLADYLKSEHDIDGFVYKNEMEGFNAHNNAGTDSILILSPQHYQVSQQVQTVNPRSLAEYYMRHLDGLNIHKYQNINLARVKSFLE